MREQPLQPARDLALIVVFACITAALGLIPPIPTPLSPTPITAQSLGPMLAGVVLGGRRGGLSQVLFLALAALGLPVLSGGGGGLARLMGPSAGFLIGFAVSALLVGWAVYRIGAPYSWWKSLIVLILGSMVVMYLCGSIGLMVIGKLTFWQALIGNIAYVPGDLVKVVAAALIGKGVHASLPGMLPWRSEPAELAAGEAPSTSGASHSSQPGFSL